MLRPVCNRQVLRAVQRCFADYGPYHAQFVRYVCDVRNRLLTQRPDSPRCLNSHRCFSHLRDGLIACDFKSAAHSACCPWRFVSSGFGSNVSTCDTPPSMNKKITRFARGANCGVIAFDSAAAQRLARPAKASWPKAMFVRRMKSRR